MDICRNTELKCWNITIISECKKAHLEHHRTTLDTQMSSLVAQSILDDAIYGTFGPAAHTYGSWLAHQKSAVYLHSTYWGTYPKA